MEVILWGLLTTAVGLFVVYLSRRFWLARPEWNIEQWVVAVVGISLGFFAVPVSIAGWGVRGIPLGIGVGLLLLSLPVILYWAKEYNDRMWMNLGGGTLQRNPKLEERLEGGRFEWIVRFFGKR